jgi:hypothetical protein
MPVDLGGHEQALRDRIRTTEDIGANVIQAPVAVPAATPSSVTTSTPTSDEIAAPYVWDAVDEHGEAQLYEYFTAVQAVNEYRTQLEACQDRKQLETLYANGASLREILRSSKYAADARMLDGIYGRVLARITLAEEKAAAATASVPAATAPPASPVARTTGASDLAVPYDFSKPQASWYKPAAAKLMELQRSKASAEAFREFQRVNAAAINDLKEKSPPHWRMLMKNLNGAKQ